jgi:hypothetical protein
MYPICHPGVHVTNLTPGSADHLRGGYHDENGVFVAQDTPPPPPGAETTAAAGVSAAETSETVDSSGDGAMTELQL